MSYDWITTPTIQFQYLDSVSPKINTPLNRRGRLPLHQSPVMMAETIAAQYLSQTAGASYSHVLPSQLNVRRICR